MKGLVFFRVWVFSNLNWCNSRALELFDVRVDVINITLLGITSVGVQQRVAHFQSFLHCFDVLNGRFSSLFQATLTVTKSRLTFPRIVNAPVLKILRVAPFPGLKVTAG